MTPAAPDGQDTPPRLAGAPRQLADIAAEIEPDMPHSSSILRLVADDVRAVLGRPDVTGGRDITADDVLDALVNQGVERTPELTNRAIAEQLTRIARPVPPGECPTPCDDDCEAGCHETHEVPAKRAHDVEACLLGRQVAVVVAARTDGQPPADDVLARIRVLAKRWLPGPGAPDTSRTRARAECGEDVLLALAGRCRPECSEQHTYVPGVCAAYAHESADLPLAGLPRLDAPAADPVNHPKHYTSHPSGVECIDIAEHMGFNLGNALKYLWRAGLKNDAIEDLRKARWYLDRELTRRESRRTEASS